MRESFRNNILISRSVARLMAVRGKLNSGSTLAPVKAVPHPVTAMTPRNECFLSAARPPHRDIVKELITISPLEKCVRIYIYIYIYVCVRVVARNIFVAIINIAYGRDIYSL